MSLLFQQQTVTTSSSETWTNSKKISSANSMYKTEIDLAVVRPHTQHGFGLAHKDSIPALSCENPPASLVISPPADMDAAVSTMSGPAVDPGGCSEVKVETRPIGKISALITRFNDGEPGALDDKIPNKKFILDLESVHKRYDNIGQKVGASSSGQADQVISVPGSETPRLPIVEHNFRLNTKTVNSKEAMVDTNISTTHKQLCAFKIPPKPLPKPTITKNPSHQPGITYSQNSQASGEDSIRALEVRHEFPSVNNELPRRDNSGKASWARHPENGRNKHVPSAISASPCSGNDDKIIHAQNKETATRTVALSGDSNNGCDVHQQNDSVSKDHPQETDLKESLRDFIVEKQRKATVLKPAVLSRHGSISRHNQSGNNGKIVSDNLVVASIATVAMTKSACSTLSLGAGGQLATFGESGSTFCPGSDVIKTEKQDDLINNNKTKDVTPEEKENFPVKDNVTDSPIYYGMGNITKLCESRNRSMEGNHTPIDCTIDRPASSSPNVNCSSEQDSSIGGFTTSIELRVGSSTECTKSSSSECKSSIASIVGECSTSGEPIVAACSTSKELNITACTTSREPSVAARPTCIGSTFALSPTSREPSVALSPTSREPSVALSPTSRERTVVLSPGSREPSLAPCPLRDHRDGGNAISAKLGMLKSELMAMRKMDLVLLRQLINISQAIRRIQRSDLPKVSRSLTILSARRTPQPTHKPVERQNSAPHCADRRRFLFSNVRWKTDEDYRDSLSSFDESEFDSQSELENSSSSLNSTTTSSSRAFSCPRVLFHSCNIPLSLDVSEEADENYEDILQRNVRLWKMSFQRHQSQQEKLDVWF